MEPTPFIVSWWHASDVESAHEVLRDSLAALGVPPVPAARLEAAARTIADETDARRHQIGIAARHANEQLARLGRATRVRAFRESAEWAGEDDEPVWLIVEPDEHERLLAVIGAPEDIEAAYDNLDGPDPLTLKQPTGPRIPKHPGELFLFAHEQIRVQNFAVALEAIERLLATGYDADDVVLVELARISTLRSLSRHDDARAAWTATADAWLAGTRRVWLSQWVSLEKLHAKLRMPDVPQLLAIAEHKKTAPQ